MAAPWGGGERGETAPPLALSAGVVGLCLGVHDKGALHDLSVCVDGAAGRAAALPADLVTLRHGRKAQDRQGDARELVGHGGAEEQPVHRP